MHVGEAGGGLGGPAKSPTPGGLTPGRLRRLLVPKGLAWLFAGGGGFGGVLFTVPPRAIYYLTAAGGLTYAARYAVHLRMRYGRASRQLAGLMRADLVVVIAFNALAVASIAWEPPSGVMFLSVLTLFAAVLLVSGATIEAAKGKRKRGSEWLRKTKLVKWVERSLRPHANIFGKPILWLIRLATPVRHASCYIVCLLAMLAIVAAAAGRASLPAIEKDLASGGGSSSPSQTDTITTASPSASGAATNSSSPVEEDPPPTYEQLCRGHAPPGYPAPEPQAAGLRALFAHAGAIVAGCAEPATQVSAAPGVWLTLGRCGRQVRSLALVGPERAPVLMLQQVASFAQAKAAVGELTGASARLSAAHGDYQVIETTGADFVMARASSSLGAGGSAKTARSCSDISGRDSPYTIVPPGLIELWVQLARRTWVWPVATGQSTYPRQFIFVSAGPAPLRVASAQCSSRYACIMQASDGTDTSSESDGRMANELARYAPPAAR